MAGKKVNLYSTARIIVLIFTSILFFQQPLSSVQATTIWNSSYFLQQAGRQVITPTTANRLKSLTRFGKGYFWQISWSPDGDTIAAAGTIGVWIFSINNPENAPRLLETSHVVTSVSYSHDNALLAIGDETGAVRIVDARTLVEMQAVKTNGAFRLIFSPDDKYLAVVSGYGNIVQLWDVISGTEIINYNQADDAIFGASFNSTSTLLSVIEANGKVLIFDLKTKSIATTIQLPNKGVASDIAFSADDQFLLVSFTDGNIVKITSSNSPQEIFPINALSERYLDAVNPLLLMKNGTEVLFQVPDAGLEIWNITLAQRTKSIQLDGEPYIVGAWSLSLNPDETKVAYLTASNANIYIVDLATGLRRNISADFTEVILCTAFNSNGTSLTTVDEQQIYEWRISDFEIDTTRSIDTKYGNVSPAACADNGNVVVAYFQGTIAVLSNNRETQIFANDRTFTSSIDPLAINRSGSVIAYNDAKGNVLIRDLIHETETLINDLPDTRHITLSANGDYFAYGTFENEFGIWDISHNRLHFKDAIPKIGLIEGVSNLAFNRDSSLLAVGTSNGQIYIYDLENMQLKLKMLLQSEAAITSLAFNPTSEILASGEFSENNLVTLWDLDDGTLLVKLQAHADTISSLDFSPDGTLLVSGSWDGTAHLWGIN